MVKAGGCSFALQLLEIRSLDKHPVPKWAQPPAGELDRLGICIQTQQQAIWTGSTQNAGGMTRRTQCCVDVPAARPDPQTGQYLVKEDRSMWLGHRPESVTNPT